MWSRSLLDLVRGLRRAGARPSSIRRVIVTHFHVDHSTASLMMYYMSGAELAIGERDLGVITGGVEEYIEGALSLFLQNGMPKSEIEEIRKAHPALRLREFYEEASSLEWRPLRAGDRLRAGGSRLEVVEAPGHTPGHIILKLPDNSVVVGDVILDGITPHVTIHDWDTDPLGDYLRTLSMIVEMDPVVAYPGHRDPIQRPAERAKEIILHHRKRLDEILSILRNLKMTTGYDVARRVRWRSRYPRWEEYPAPEKFFAMGEALAHLRRLELEGLAERVEKKGVLYWKSA